MIVVVIIGILAAIAGPTFMRYQRRSLTLEASEVLTQIVHAQEAYRAQFNMFSDTSNDLTLAAPTTNGASGGLGTWWPALGTAAAEPTGMVDFYASLPLSWNQLGVRPRRMVRFAYQTIAGNPGVIPTVGPSGNLGYSSLPAGSQGQWFYATASGDLDRDGTYSRFEVSSITRGMHVIGEETE
jgi:type II secretory pathway pseudopilin PulG